MKGYLLLFSEMSFLALSRFCILCRGKEKSGAIASDKSISCPLILNVKNLPNICRYNFSDSLKIGVGMMTRGEVALIVAQKGMAAGLLTADYFTAVILLILVSSFMTPIILKFLYSRDDRLANKTA